MEINALIGVFGDFSGAMLVSLPGLPKLHSGKVKPNRPGNENFVTATFST